MKGDFEFLKKKDLKMEEKIKDYYEKMKDFYGNNNYKELDPDVRLAKMGELA